MSEDLQQIADEWREAHREIVRARQDLSTAKERVTSAESRRDAHSKKLLASVGRNIDTRVFTVEGGHLIVRHDAKHVDSGVRFVEDRG